MLIDGLDYRFDISHANDKSFIDDTYSKLTNVSGQLNYRVSDNFKVWGAYEYKQDADRFYWGTPLVPANFPGIVPTNGIVSGTWTNYYLNGRSGTPNPVTIDARTLTTTYNVLDNHSGANELWLRGGFQCDVVGGSVRHVGDRFNFKDNFVTMNAYTLFDAYAFVDVPKSVFNGVDKTRISFRVKNLTNKLYAQWGDPGYTDQVILGAPRSYEVAASFKW